MTKTPWKTIIITALVTLIIVTIGGAFIINFLSTPGPILYINPPNLPRTSCLVNGWSVDGEYELHLSNKAETPGYSTLCFSGDNLIFQLDNKNYSNTICYNERTINPKSSDLVQVYAPKAILNNSNEDNNFSITTKVDCRYRILSLIPKNCEGIQIVCNYKKSGSRYVSLNQ